MLKRTMPANAGSGIGGAGARCMMPCAGCIQNCERAAALVACAWHPARPGAMVGVVCRQMLWAGKLPPAVYNAGRSHLCKGGLEGALILGRDGHQRLQHQGWQLLAQDLPAALGGHHVGHMRVGVQLRVGARGPTRRPEERQLLLQRQLPLRQHRLLLRRTGLLVRVGRAGAGGWGCGGAVINIIICCGRRGAAAGGRRLRLAASQVAAAARWLAGQRAAGTLQGQVTAVYVHLLRHSRCVRVALSGGGAAVLAVRIRGGVAHARACQRDARWRSGCGCRALGTCRNKEPGCARRCVAWAPLPRQHRPAEPRPACAPRRPSLVLPGVTQWSQAHAPVCRRPLRCVSPRVLLARP